ncbi:MAG: hypothetical protein IJF92_05330 [Bacilli bacterium]|nr:hypothetical protein [Bacilli bacterium]
MNKIKKKRNMYLLIVFVVALVIGIGYAILSNNLNIAGSTNIKDNTWNIHFENLNVTSGSVSATTPTISNGTNITYTVTLDKPGDYYEFSVDVKNAGSIDAMISGISNTGLTSEQKKYMTYSATYDSGVDIAEKQELKANSKERIRVTVRYRYDINVSDLPSEEKVLNLTLNMNYVQKNDTAVTINNPTCRRATTLHTETCNNENGCASTGAGYNIGDKITYGNLGTAGTLAGGDAFDCDVNGDREYNSETERFYYVNSLDTDNNYGVLIYYNNVSEGEPNEAATYAYDSENAPRDNGPVTLLPQLPSTTQWKNVSLSNQTRKIKDQNGAEYIDFTYTGRAARLLTYQEVVSACGTGTSSSTGYLDSCKYMLENTKYSNSSLKYGLWLENISSNNAYNAMYVHGSNRRINNYGSSSNGVLGVRPIIEVEKSNISY